jgi:hypothetical protein
MKGGTVTLYLPPFEYVEYLVDRRDPRPPHRVEPGAARPTPPAHLRIVR